MLVVRLAIEESAAVLDHPIKDISNIHREGWVEVTGNQMHYEAVFGGETVRQVPRREIVKHPVNA